MKRLRHSPMELVITYDPRVPGELPDATRRAITGRSITVAREGRVGRTGRTTIVMVTENQLPETKLCVESVLAHGIGSQFEIVIVDNGSTDGTVRFLEKLSRLAPQVAVTFNKRSRGLVPARNQGLALAQGETVVLLGQDCIVPPGWLDRLLAPLADAAVGLVGPVTNCASTDAQVFAGYSTLGEFIEFASGRESEPPFDIRVLNGFCLAMRRDVYEHLGPLDERFDIAPFQDEDLVIRVKTLGYRVVCAPSVFVHHGGSTVVGHLTSAGLAGPRFQQVRQSFEEKWAVRWHAYDHFNASQFDLLRRIRSVILQSIPAEATVLVVSRGDDELLALAPRAWHFPRLDDGTYAGHYPADSSEAIAHLEQQRQRGAEFLVIPKSASWWLTYYGDWHRHLEGRYRKVVADDRTCLVFDLRDSKT